MIGWATALSTVKDVNTVAKELGFWDKIRDLLKQKRKILVLGASGAGKTQFVNSLGEGSKQTPRTVAVEKRSLRIGTNLFVFSDTPGQQLDEAKRKVAITEANRTKIDGVVNIVCYGYHEAIEARKRDAIPTSGGHIARKEFLEFRRGEELKLLSEWVPILDLDTVRWVLTIVTKADLWWPERERIETYYSAGTYIQALGTLKSVHTVLPYCSRIEPYYGTKTSGKFGETQKLALREHLLDSLLRLCDIQR